MTQKMPKEWFASSVILIIGVFLVTGMYEPTFLRSLDITGVILGLASGLAFSLFTIFWSRTGVSSMNLAQRSFMLGLFMIITGILIYPAHILFKLIFLDQGHVFVVQVIPPRHIVIQALNGFIGLGLAYFLINESLKSLRVYGHFSALLVGLGLSYSVFFTYLGETILFGDPFTLPRWLGVVLFSIGFTAVRNNIFGGNPSGNAI